MSSQMFWLLSYVSLGLALSLGNRATGIHGSSSSSSSSSSPKSSVSSLSSSSSASSHQQQAQGKQQAATSGLRTRQEIRIARNEANLRYDGSPLILELDDLPPYRYEKTRPEAQRVANFRHASKDVKEENDVDENDEGEDRNNDSYYRYNNINMNNKINHNNYNYNRNNINNNINNDNDYYYVKSNINNSKNNRNRKGGRGRTGSNIREGSYLDEFAIAVLDGLDPRDRRLLVSGRTFTEPWAGASPGRIAELYRPRRPPLRSRNPFAIGIIGNNENNEVTGTRETLRSQTNQLYDRDRALRENNRRDSPLADKYASVDRLNEVLVGAGIETSEPFSDGTKVRSEITENEREQWYVADKAAIKRNDGTHARVTAGARSPAPQWNGNGQPQSPSPPGGASIASQFLLRSARGNRQYDVPQIECPASEDGMERFACPTPDRMGRYRCIDDHVLCDGFIDCPSAEDEDRQACMFYKTTKAHLDVLADALLRWARGR